MAPVTSLFGPVVSYNLLTTLGFAFAAWIMTLALRRFTQGWISAAVGGLVYGFSPYMFSQALGHVGLNFQIVTPLLLLLAHEAVVRQKWSPLENWSPNRNSLGDSIFDFS